MEYRIPPGVESARRAIWRLLKARSALKLSTGSWAVPHPPNDDPGLAVMLARARDEGGSATARRVTLADEELQAQLQRACQAVWDGFFNHVDQLAWRLGRQGMPVAPEELDELRREYRRRLIRDLVVSDGAHRAADRLREVIERSLAGSDAVKPAPERMRALQVKTSWRYEDGSIRRVVCIDPTPTASWDHGFTAFEAATYTPDPDRVPLVHGAFVITTDIGDDEALEQLRRRVQMFERTLG